MAGLNSHRYVLLYSLCLAGAAAVVPGLYLYLCSASSKEGLLPVKKRRKKRPVSPLHGFKCAHLLKNKNKTKIF